MSEFAGKPKRETYPILSNGDTLVVVFRDHLVASAIPVAFFTSLSGSASIDVSVGTDLDVDNFAAVTTINLSQIGHSTRLTMSPPTSVIEKVWAFTVTNGAASADIRSPIECRSYLRQPLTLRPTTGEPHGAWPFGPNPAAP